MQNRIYAFDKLRAIMMLLVVLVHAGLAYTSTHVIGYWTFIDTYNTNPLFNITTAFMRTFLMPIFFIISGFLTSMLYFERGPNKMLLNRVHRILYPLIVGLIVLYPSVMVAINYFMLVKSGVINPFDKAVYKFIAEFNWRAILPMHLWFLYYLIWYCVAGWGLTLLFSRYIPGINAKIKNLFKTAFLLKLSPVLFAAVSFLCLAKMKSPLINTPYNFLLSSVFLTYSCFFIFGWLLYHHKAFLKRFLDNDVLFAFAGVLFFSIEFTLIMIKPGIESTHFIYALVAFNALSSWFLAFGFIGLFIRYFNGSSAIGLYIAESSYWVYLVHFPIVLVFQSWLLKYDFNPFLKFFIVSGCTLIITFLSYNYLVRNTFIGKFLNGRKQKRGIPKLEKKIANAGAIS